MASPSALGLVKAGVLALAVIVPVIAQRGEFSADDVSGSFEEREGNGRRREGEDAAEDTLGEIERASFDTTGTLVRLCGCTNDDFDFEPASLDDIRAFSDEFMAGGNAPSQLSLTNLVWAWGQFLDHDLVATVDAEEGAEYTITLTLDGEPTDSQMIVHRLEVEMDDDTQCRMPVVVNTPLIDAGTVYGSSEEFLQNVLREPGSCKLRTSPGDLLPVTTTANEDGVHFLVAGDTRVNEHGVIASMHTVWMREHNRLCDSFEEDAEEMSDSMDDLFERARMIVIAKFQEITLKQFLPVLGISEQDVRDFDPALSSPDISVEFFIGYRVGHDMIPDSMGAWNVVDIFDGDGFMGVGASGEGSADPDAANADMDSVLQAAADNLSNEVDGMFSDAIRDTLFGAFGEDLASRNLFRGREVGLPGYGELAECMGFEPNAEVANTTDDAFLGLLRENTQPGVQVLGPTLARILTDQFHRVFFGPGGHYWADDDEHVAAVAGRVEEIENTSLGAVISANTGADVAGVGFVQGAGAQTDGRGFVEETDN